MSLKYVTWKPIHDFLYDTISLTIYELLANKTTCKKFDIENEGQAGENGTFAIRLEMFVSFYIGIFS